MTWIGRYETFLGTVLLIRTVLEPVLN